MNYKKTKLDSGLRVITVPKENTQAVSVLVLVKTGSKYETKEINGVSHFLEHMFFKGTDKRPTKRDISEELDKIGGIYNAFTSREYTGYWAKVSTEHSGLALDWVSDIFLNSKLEKEEMEKEKGVIIEEINMYLDSPRRYVSDLWEKLLYDDQPAGWLTIGSKENVKNMKREELVNYFEDHYSASNTVVCVAGNFEENEMIRKVKKAFKGVNKEEPEGRRQVEEKQENPEVLNYFKDTDQTHLRLGTRGFSLENSKKYPQGLLAAVLGKGMSSRLFMNIREDKGLAYYVGASPKTYMDTGYLVSSCGIPHDNVEEVISLILEEFQDIKENKVSKEELKKAKNFLKGRLALRLESSDSLATYYGMQELLKDEILTPEEKFEILDEVTSEQVKKVAEEMFKPENLNLALIGPHKDKNFKDNLKI